MFTKLALRRAALPTVVQRAYISVPRKGLNTQQKEIVKSTIPALQEHGVTITTLFYKRLLEAHPELKNIFNTAHQATGEQPAALAHAVWAYASNIDHPEALSTAVSRIGHKHASLGVMPEHYPIVGQHLLVAIKDVLGPAVNEKVLDAWGAAYQELADIFINFEDGLYQENLKTAGGWKGWRKFFISDKVVESDEIISFYLIPEDRDVLPKYKPGQFVSIRCYVPELSSYQPRQYSLSDVPSSDHFRISVKREFARDAKPAGRISNVLHESLPIGAELDVSMPFGDFVLDTNATTPAVLISGGVGLTPMMSMLKSIVDQQGQARQVVFIHAARNGRVHAMKDDLNQIVSHNPAVSRMVFYENVTDGEKQGVDYDYVGRVDLAQVKDKVVLSDADYYICGPQPFMKAQSKSLEALGVEGDHIHMEVFGSPHD
ncbi:flavohemoprotein [Penicillium macrosclerotiorum]|uniref:flavohemoprotein n=1 Tax=Penicillium macrosclerotiorum TaxID=303699 RepID=UPI0025496A5C|nr:flavohemoprotein [Penicillium macrosclerotiorum]KAJ5678831.1 flavohemoprotein [Penicillium macrosclerotiorum]